jgi:UDP-N-acetylglucosamine:LPS N-acetylglucosamine transferase
LAARRIGQVNEVAAVDERARVLIVTASMGAGHTELAAELARRIGDHGAVPEVLDVISAAGRAGARLRRTYRLLLAHAPWLYDGAMRFWARWPRPLEALTAAGGRAFDRALREGVAATGPDVVVCTYDLAAQALGRLIGRGAVDVPVITFVTDPGAHPYWIGKGIATHLVLTGATARGMREFGARGVQVVRPVLRPEFHAPASRADARARLGLPAGARIVLVNGGSWAAGAVEATVGALSVDPALHVVVLCGRDERLRARLGACERVRPVAWTPAVAGYLSAADVVVDNAGGLTCWESLAVGTPVLLYRTLPGHGRLNAATLDACGLARWVRRPEQLLPAVAAAIGTRGRLPDPATAGDAIACILAAVPSSHTVVP